MNNVGNHIFLWCKIFGLKIRRCKNLDKYHVWARGLTFNQESSDNMPPRNYWLGCLVFQISIYFKSLWSSASPHKKHVEVVGQWSSSQQGWTTSSTSSQVGQAKLKFTLQQLFNYNGGQGGARFSQLAASSLEGHQLILIIWSEEHFDIQKKNKCWRMQVSIVLFAFVYESQPKVHKVIFFCLFYWLAHGQFFLLFWVNID